MVPEVQIGDQQTTVLGLIGVGGGGAGGGGGGGDGGDDDRFPRHRSRVTSFMHWTHNGLSFWEQIVLHVQLFIDNF